jgi:hypothetical protein
MCGVASSPAKAMVADTTPPTVELSGALPGTTIEAAVRVRGVARDYESGVSSVEIYSSSLDLTMAAELDSGGNFVLDVPLEVGANQLEIRATNAAALQSAPVALAITRSLPAVPSLVIDEPSNSGGPIFTTDPTINLRGRVWTSLPLGDFSIRMGERQAIPLSGDTSFFYQFDNVALAIGINNLEIAVFSPFGAVRKTIQIQRMDPNALSELAPPQIQLGVGQDYLAIDSPTTTLSGTVSAPHCVQRLVVNGLEPDRILPIGPGQVSFQSTFVVPPGVTYPVVVEATGCNAQEAAVTVTYVLDDAPPVIVLESPVLSETVVAVSENPLRVAGTIEESALVGAVLNGLPLQVEPDVTPGRWRFEAAVKLNRGQETELLLAAWDRAGQRAATLQKVLLQNAVHVEMVTPREGAKVGLEGTASYVEAQVQVRDAATSDQVYASIDGGPAVLLGTGEGVHRADLAVALPPGPEAVVHTLSSWVQSESDGQLARTTAKFEVVDLATVPVALVRQEPSIGALDVEADAGLTLYFNRPIDPEQIQIHVRETVRGVVFRGAKEGEFDLRTQSKIERVQLDKTHEPVAGRSQNLPGNRAYSFFPASAWNYGATIEVEVLVNGASVSSSNFTVRKFPTLVHGFVTTELYEPLSGIEVLLPDLGLSARSDCWHQPTSAANQARTHFPKTRRERIRQSGVRA